jgi:hypothetical protein
MVEFAVEHMAGGNLREITNAYWTPVVVNWNPPTPVGIASGATIEETAVLVVGNDHHRFHPTIRFAPRFDKCQQECLPFGNA